MTTRLDTSGAAAAARKRSWACSTPALTTASPYSQTWGTNITSSPASTAALPAQSALAKARPYSRRRPERPARPG